MEIIVGVGDMKMSSQPEDKIVTYHLGSCLGIALYDPEVKVGGIIHCMLPDASMSPRKTLRTAFTFVDTGVPLLFKLLYLAGAQRDRLRVYVAGGASFKKDLQGIFDIGKRNLMALHNIVVAEGIAIRGMEIGGHVARTLRLDIQTGRVWVRTAGKVRDL
jgi:chemotaxis protein CheD